MHEHNITVLLFPVIGVLFVVLSCVKTMVHSDNGMMPESLTCPHDQGALFCAQEKRHSYMEAGL